MASSTASRFSGLKVFKFSSKDKEGPPPPPPKDDFYLRNRSMASLAPDSMSLAPNSPRSPRHPFGQPSPDVNQSSMSLASSTASALSSPPPEPKSRPQSRGKERALAFLRLGKRSPRSPSSSRTNTDDSEPPDDGISMPWNFQHNIHVDDGLSGMPPSWSTSLAAHGFSDEEITQLQLRRQDSIARSPSTQALFNRRPNSPTISHPYQPNVPLLANPAPRTTSLPRQFSNTSLRSQQPPPIPTPSGSTSSLQSTRLVPQRRPNHTPQLSVSHSSDSGSSKEDCDVPRKASFPSDFVTSRSKAHTVNGSIASSMLSSSAPADGHQRMESSRFQLTTSASSFFRPRTKAIEGDSSTNGITFPKLPPVGQSTIQAKRIAPSAPRLSISLHSRTDSTDLSSWAGTLLDNFASDDMVAKSTLSQPKSPQSAPTNRSVPVLAENSRATQSVPAAIVPPPEPSRPTTTKFGPPSRPRPLSNLVEDAFKSPQWSADMNTDSSPLWSQLEGILGHSLESKESSDEHGPYSAALAETFSPTLPLSPEEERMATQRKMRTDASARELPTIGQTLSGVEEGGELDDHRLSVNTMRPNRDSSRSSTSTILGLAVPTIVRNVSFARRAGAYMVDKSKARAPPPGPPPTSGLPTPPTTTTTVTPTLATSSEERFPPSPLSSHFDASEDGYYNQNSTPSSGQSQEAPTPTSDSAMSPLQYYLQPSPDPSPSPSQGSFSPLSLDKGGVAVEEPWGNVEDDEEYEDDESGISLVVPPKLATKTMSPSVVRPTIVINDVPQVGPSTAMPSGSPLSPFQRYRGWLSEVVAPLEDFIDESVDPRDHYLDLKEIAEGESGSVYSARLTHQYAARLRLPPLVKAKDSDDIANGRDILVAIKSVAIVPSGSPKLNDLRRELELMRGLCQENLIGLDALYVDLLEDTLWIRMELMERSLADVVELVDEGLMLQDRTMARFAGDILKGLEYLQQHNIAHRDIRSDNLLLSKQGILKIADFANAVQVTAQNPMLMEPAGVLYWQAPEIRNPPYNTLKVDVWSLGATVWEMAETQPPFADTNQFADRWPSVQTPEVHSPAFHEFLYLCSEPAATRPTPSELLTSSFINNACGRSVIVHLLSQCIAIEGSLG